MAKFDQYGVEYSDQDYDEMKELESRGWYADGQVMWHCIRDEILEIAGKKAFYTFWDE